MDPSQPSQPPQSAAYTTDGNPAETVPSEDRAAQAQSQQNANAAVTDQRVPSTHSGDPVPSSLGRGVRGAGPGEESKGYTQEDFESQDLEGQQMRAPGEGEVATAVGGKPGASGGEGDFASDLDRYVGGYVSRFSVG